MPHVEPRRNALEWPRVLKGVSELLREGDAAADPDGGSSGVRTGPTDWPAERAKQDRPLPHVRSLDGDREQAGLGKLLLLEQLLDLAELVEGISEDVGGGHR